MGLLSLLGCDSDLADSAHYKNGQLAYEKKGSQVFFYDHTGAMTKEINLETGILKNYNTVSLLQIEQQTPLSELSEPVVFLWDKKQLLPVVTERIYNNLNLITEEISTAADDGGGGFKDHVKYQYNEYGQLKKTSDVFNAKYDQLGRLVSYKAPRLQNLDSNTPRKYSVEYDGEKIKQVKMVENLNEIIIREYIYENDKAIKAIEKKDNGELMGVLYFKYNEQGKISEIQGFYKTTTIYEKKQTFSYEGKNLIKHSEYHGSWIDDSHPIEVALEPILEPQEMWVDLDVVHNYQYEGERLVGKKTIENKDHNYDEPYSILHQTTYNYNEKGQMVDYKTITDGEVESGDQYLYND